MKKTKSRYYRLFVGAILFLSLGQFAHEASANQRLDLDPFGLGHEEIFSRKEMAVALLGSVGFDVRTIVKNSVAFGAEGFGFIWPSRGKGRKWPSRGRGRKIDVNADGYPDLLFYFRSSHHSLSPLREREVERGVLKGAIRDSSGMIREFSASGTLLGNAIDRCSYDIDFKDRIPTGVYCDFKGVPQDVHSNGGLYLPDFVAALNAKFPAKFDGDTLVTIEANGGFGTAGGPTSSGSCGAHGGARGESGYMVTVQKLQFLGDYLFMYIAQSGDTHGAGGASTIASKRALEDISDANVNDPFGEQILVIAGGGGGGGGANKTSGHCRDGRPGGGGGVHTAVEVGAGYTVAPGGTGVNGGGEGGSQKGDGEGGAGGPDNGSDPGVHGIGGFGGLHDNNKDQAEWKGGYYPSDWWAGSGAWQDHGLGAGGGGYGGGGGGGTDGDHFAGGGGGGSFARNSVAHPKRTPVRDYWDPIVRVTFEFK